MSVCSKTGAGSLRGLKKFSSPLKAISDSSSDTVIYEVVLEKEQGSLGIITSEGDNCDRNKRLYVQSLVPGGPAELGGILQPGDYLLELNGQSLCGVTRTDLGKALLSAPDICLLKIARTKSLDDLTQDQYTEQNVVVDLVKTPGGGLGFTVVGGVNSTGGCYVKAVVQDPALSDGRLHAGDRLIQVNGQDMTGLSHFEAVTLLRQAPKDVSIKVWRSSTTKQQDSSAQSRAKKNTGELDQAVDETSTGLVQIVLNKPQLRDSLGFSLVQRCIKCGQTGIFIKTLTPGGIAHSDGELKVGDRLLQVNGESLIGCSHTKAVRLLREATGSVILSIFRSSESHFDSNDTEGTDILPRDDSHPGSKKNSHPTPSSSTYSSDYPYDDNINDILDEAINVLDSQDKEVTKNLKPGSGEQNLLMSTGIRKQSTPDQGEQYPPTSTIHAESCLQSNPRIMDYCCSSKYSPLPVHEEVSGLSNKMCEKHEEGKMKCTSYAQKLSSVEIPEDLTSMSLPILRMTKEVEEKTVQLLQFLADAVEQEEPLLEFEKLRQMKATDNMEVAKLPENKSLNRYRNVLPYDYNRIKLQTNSPGSNDYINASDIHLSVKDSEEPLCYIACQGPLLTTQGHFWRMVWEAGSNVVAMLTQEVESGKVKCHRYWPQAPDEFLELCEGKYTVLLVKEQKVGDFIKRQLRLFNHDCGEEREVVHLHYTTWPDHGVPDSAYPMLQFIRLMHQLHQNGPFVVHCSAGIGRSGVLIAVDAALARIETSDELDLFDIASELRQQRYGMIQTQDQYLFCYTACMEALLSKER